MLVIFAVVGCCNATNLMDGLDGLCGGVTAIIAAGFLFLAVHLAMSGGVMNSNWDALRVVLGLALLGAVLGFIPYNFNPASIFMGDTGSMFLGFSLRHADHPAGAGAAEVVPGVDGDVRAAGARHGARLRPALGRTAGRSSPPTASTSTTSSSPAGFTVRKTV